MSTPEQLRTYWRKTLGITAILLAVWFVASFGVVYWAADLDRITFLGFPLGFYMAAQGSLIVYVVSVWVYARYMNRLDKQHGVAED
jgi:putative solute:sodium symporter small subunit